MSITKSVADVRLIRWGAWSKYSLGLGYSPMNPIGRMMDDAWGSGHVTVPAGIPMDSDIQQTDAIIGRFRKEIKKAVKIYYIAGLSSIMGSKRCRCSEDEFTRRINYAIDIISTESE